MLHTYLDNVIKKLNSKQMREIQRLLLEERNYIAYKILIRKVFFPVTAPCRVSIWG